jgi:threonine/homoserine/homoserine lactone efflux protein
MMEVFSSPKPVAFAIASVLIAIAPGPAVVYLLTQTLSRGRHAGLVSVGGVALGSLMNATAACLGLAAVLATSATAFFVLRMVGAAYLVFLGVKALRTTAGRRGLEAPPGGQSVAVFRDAVLVAFLNPKTTFFYVALLPQFVDLHARSPLTQSLNLAGIFIAITVLTNTLYVLAASGLRAAIAERSVWAQYGGYLSAGAFIALGIYAAVAGPRLAR